FVFFFQAEDGIRDRTVTGVQTCALPIFCSFNMHKVTRHVLVPDGATFKTTDTDFLTSDNPDFHPTDVIEDADGSLVVIDTGGWRSEERRVGKECRSGVGGQV